MSGLDNKDELIYCCKCGAPNRKEADFCRSCGETLDKDIPEAYNSNKVTKKQNENLPPPPPQKPPAQQQPQYYNNHQRLPERKNKGGLFKRKRSKIPVAIFITIGIVFLLMFIYFSVYDTVIIVDLSDQITSYQMDDDVTIYVNGEEKGSMKVGEKKTFRVTDGGNYTIEVKGDAYTMAGTFEIIYWETQVEVEDGGKVIADDWN